MLCNNEKMTLFVKSFDHRKRFLLRDLFALCVALTSLYYSELNPEKILWLMKKNIKSLNQ